MTADEHSRSDRAVAVGVDNDRGGDEVMHQLRDPRASAAGAGS